MSDVGQLLAVEAGRNLQLSANIESILREHAIESRPCKHCSVTLWFFRARNKEVIAYTYDGTNHRENCAARKNVILKPEGQVNA